MKFGRGWEFTSAPRGPDQVTYVLYFATMKFYTDDSGRPVTGVKPKINIARLEQFYNTHRLYVRFMLNIPGKGPMTVRFSKPLEYKVKEGGQGTVEAFQVEVVTQP